MSLATTHDNDLRQKLAKWKAIDPQETGPRAGEAAEMLEEILRLRVIERHAEPENANVRAWLAKQ